MSASQPTSPRASRAALKTQEFSISQTLNRQLTNFTSFLAPPPLTPYNSSTPSPELQDSGENSGQLQDSGKNSADGSLSPSSYEGIKNDLVEISDSFKSSLALLSPKKAVNQLSKFASSLFFDKGVDDCDNDVVKGVGINDGVLEFVRGVSSRPECWIEFPGSLHNKDFSMSDAQKDHTLAIEQLVPDLTTLKHKILNCLREEQFWMIYFILLIPRLNVDDYRLLSTPEIIQVREVLLQQLRDKKNTLNEKGSMVNSTKQSENPFRETKSLVGEASDVINRMKSKNNEDDVSFSDVETQSCRLSSASENSDWVRLTAIAKANRSKYRERHSESEESSDWHAVDDADL